MILFSLKKEFTNKLLPSLGCFRIMERTIAKTTAIKTATNIAAIDQITKESSDCLFCFLLSLAPRGVVM